MTKYPFPKPIAIICKHISEQLRDIQVSDAKLQQHDQEFLTLLTHHLSTYLNKAHSGAVCECFKKHRELDPDTTLCNCEDRCRSVCQAENSSLRLRLQQQIDNHSQAVQESVQATQQRMSADMAYLNRLFQDLQDLRVQALPSP